MRSPKGYVVIPKVNAQTYISRLVYDLRAFSCLLDQVRDLLGLLERHARVKEKEGAIRVFNCLYIWYRIANRKNSAFKLHCAILMVLSIYSCVDCIHSLQR